MALPVGLRLGPYEIVAPLGAGGMGEVYRARDSRLGRDVALKVLPPDVTSDPSRLERFDREARAIAALNHPHIITLYSTEEADGVRFLTMELVEGQTLTDLIPDGGMPLPRFLEIGLALADALSAAHEKQITHRDLKPGNVMVSREGRVKVLDFGLARIGGTEIGQQSVAATRAPITHLGMLVGTMPYMSPEQVEGRPLDPRSDLFSLGVIFYELLNGERPFKGDSSPALMSSILRDAPSSVSDTRADVPEGLARLIARCLEKRPQDRVQTARDVYNELRHLQKQLESGARPSATGRAVPAVSETLCIVVLPFTVRGADADGEAIALGLTEDVTTGLAKFRGLSVAAAQTARAFKDSTVDVRQIAERLGARYVVGGNVRKSGAAVRVTAQLIDAHSATQLWTEIYDRRLDASDIFTIQDDVTDHIVATVADTSGVLARSMVRAIRQQTTIGQSNADQLLMRYWGLQHNPLPGDHAELRAALEARVEAEPDNPSVWSTLAGIYVDEYAQEYNLRPDPLGRAREAAHKALEVDASNQLAYVALALIAFFTRDMSAFHAATDRALTLNPLDTGAMSLLGALTAYTGDWDAGLALSEKAMSLNPDHPGVYWMPSIFNRYRLRDYGGALDLLNRVTMPHYANSLVVRAAIYGQLGRIDEGRALVRDAEAKMPGITSDRIGTRRKWLPAELAAHIQEGLDKLSSVPSSKSGLVTTSSGPSIAVMPFTDLSATKDQDWFCDGIAEEILNALSPLPGLHVAARASAFSLRGKTDDLRAIGEKLHVKTVLEGSVRRAGDRVRITAQLSDVAQGRQLWSERFDRELKDIFDIQDEIARGIVERLKVTLADGGRDRLVPKATANFDAYELLLKGRVLLTRRGRAIVDAMQCFERAVALDPNLSEAHALLGDAHRLTALYGLMPARESMPRARACVERALAIDPNQVEALATLANIASTYDWDIDRAVALSERALAVDPSHVRALAEQSISLVCLEAPSLRLQQRILDDVRRARGLDPLSAWVMAVESMCLASIGRLPDALAAAERAVATDADNFTAHWTLVVTLAWNGRNQEAQRAAGPALAMSQRHPRILTELAAIHAAEGNANAAEAIHVELRDRSRTGHIGFAEQAAVAAAAGRVEEARRLVAHAIAARDPYLRFWKFPAWRAVWNDQECAALLRSTALFAAAPE